MEDFLEILKYVLPSVVTGAVAFLMVKKMLEQENRRHFAEVKKENLKYTTPVRLQAHERVLLLLERIDPVKVINRVIKAEMTAKNLQFVLISAIKEEFEHNITQQLYVSRNCWLEVVKAKEDALKLIAVVGGSVDPSSSALEYSQALIKIQAEKQFYTSLSAIETVKQEINKIF